MSNGDFALGRAVLAQHALASSFDLSFDGITEMDACADDLESLGCLVVRNSSERRIEVRWAEGANAGAAA